jgi:hypothetical protein
VCPDCIISPPSPELIWVHMGGARPPHAPWRRSTDQTSTLESPANGSRRMQSGCSERQRRPASQLPHECRSEDRTMDATDTAAPETRYRGRSQTLLYNEARPHQGRWCFGKTPMQTFLDAMPMTKEKMIAASRQRTPTPDRSTRHHLSDRVPANTNHCATSRPCAAQRCQGELLRLGCFALHRKP